MTDDTLFRRSEQSLQTLQDDLAALAPVVARLDDAARQVDLLVQSAGSGKKGPFSLVQRADTLLQNLESASRDVSRAAPYLPQIAKNIAGGSADLPALLTQVQVAAADLQKLIIQLRGSCSLAGAEASRRKRGCRLLASSHEVVLGGAFAGCAAPWGLRRGAAAGDARGPNLAAARRRGKFGHGARPNAGGHRAILPAGFRPRGGARRLCRHRRLWI